MKANKICIKRSFLFSIFFIATALIVTYFLGRYINQYSTPSQAIKINKLKNKSSIYECYSYNNASHCSRSCKSDHPGYACGIDETRNIKDRMLNCCKILPSINPPNTGLWGCTQFTDEDRSTVLNDPRIDDTVKFFLRFDKKFNLLDNIQCGLDYCSPKSTYYDPDKCLNTIITGSELAVAPLFTLPVADVFKYARSLNGGLSLSSAYTNISTAAYAITDVEIATIIQSSPLIARLLSFLNKYGNVIFNVSGGASCIDNPTSDICNFFIASTFIPNTYSPPSKTESNIVYEYTEGKRMWRFNDGSIITLFENTDNTFIYTLPNGKILNAEYVLEYGGKRIPLWSVENVLINSGDDLAGYNQRITNVYNEMDTMLTNLPDARKLDPILRIPVKISRQVFLTTDMSFITGFEPLDKGMHLLPINLKIVNINYQSLDDLVISATHETIHELHARFGLIEYLEGIEKTSNETASSALYLFNEGIVDLTVRRTLAISEEIPYKPFASIAINALPADSAQRSIYLDRIIFAGNYDPIFQYNRWDNFNLFTNWFIQELDKLIKFP